LILLTDAKMFDDRNANDIIDVMMMMMMLMMVMMAMCRCPLNFWICLVSIRMGSVGSVSDK